MWFVSRTCSLVSTCGSSLPLVLLLRLSCEAQEASEAASWRNLCNPATLSVHYPPPNFPRLLLSEGRSSLEAGFLVHVLNTHYMKRNSQKTRSSRLFICSHPLLAVFREVKRHFQWKLGACETRFTPLPTGSDCGTKARRFEGRKAGNV